MYVCMLGFFTSFSNKKSRDPCFRLFPQVFHTIFAIIKALMISWDFSYVPFWAVPCLSRLVVAYHPGDSS